MQKQAFPEWLHALLRHLHLPVPLSAVQDAATFCFNGSPNVYLTGHDGQIDTMSEAGHLHAPYSSDMLLALLALNRCNGSDDPVSVTVDRASGAVIVWARQRQDALDAAGAARLLQLVRQKVDAVQQIMGRPKQVAAGQGGSISLSRMLRLHAPDR